MTLHDSIQGVATELLASDGWALDSYVVLQSLWAGYGQICELKSYRIGCRKHERHTFILKYIQPPTVSGNVRDESNLRKLISYQVEQYFYAKLAPHMPQDIGVAECLASTNSVELGGARRTAMLLTDLRPKYPIAGQKRGKLSIQQTYAALSWLAGFHGFWWSRSDELRSSSLRRPPLEEAERCVEGHGDADGHVWLNGGYTYLATRRNEYASLQNDVASEWSLRLCEPDPSASNKSIAEMAAVMLGPSLIDELSPSREYETLIHGDVKSENLFTTEQGDRVAFFDFQYVGLGLGVCDLAKFFTCSVSLDMLVRNGRVTEKEMPISDGEIDLLKIYVEELVARSGKNYPWPVLIRHWETALVDWLRFQASWGFWGNTAWLEARVRSILNDDSYIRWLCRS